MAAKYCNMCQRPVEPKRVIGVGTLLLAILTAGLALLLIPFYQKRCPVCKGSSLTDKPEPGQDGLRAPSPDTHVKCPDCRELVLKDARVCKHCGCKLMPVV